MNPAPKPWPVLLAGVVTAALVPLDRPGVGWLLAALLLIVVVCTQISRPKLISIGWAAVTVLLVGVGTVRAAGWLFTLCLLAALVTASLAVSGGRTVTALVFGAMRAFPSLTKGFGRIRGGGRMTVSIGIGVTMVAIFGALFAAADPDFAALIRDSSPTVDIGSTFRTLFLFCCGGLVAAGTLRPHVRQRVPRPSQAVVRRLEWAVPVGMLVALFAVFVGVQMVSWFGGSDYVMRTADLTYAQYARTAFWQLTAVTVLTLAVIGVTARVAPRESATDRLWLRGILGALSLLTLIVVASALSRMWAYQEAYGFTVLRLLVEACEIWLGLVYVMVIVAGVRLSGRWLPKGMLTTGIAALLVLAALNPEYVVARQDVQRWQQTQRLDTLYLSGLSVDILPALDGLPDRLKACATPWQQLPADDWREWNTSRAAARELPHPVCP
ncbi:DUF4153 domain-containing protein [Kutzneria sp. CA-103260]|uniref:DUF4153 domain-containing protein n=1 Tax=Kutzneria sp. CA-103260 TaxID=2802641 RepID=UPI001BA892CC|nr:DUF4173 domain-containing protein [Kutzneria sp. CA-103260]QUQ63192.1 hypothetical protein JJ691_09040 [Kutzneria sp. CA-103260]